MAEKTELKQKSKRWERNIMLTYPKQNKTNGREAGEKTFMSVQLLAGLKERGIRKLGIKHGNSG